MPENTPTPDPHHQPHGQRHGQRQSQLRRGSPRPARVRPECQRRRRSRPAQSWTRAAAGFADAHDWEIADLVAVGVLDAVTGQPPVPISVWRATGPDEPPTTPGELFTGLTPRVAAILLAIYTDPGDLVLDATADPAVEGAAGAGGRPYRNLDPDGSHGDAGLDGLQGGAGLVLLRWPTPVAQPRPAPKAVQTGGQSGGQARYEQTERQAGQGLLEECAHLLAPDGHTVAILAPPDGGFYRDHARTAIAAATRAGLGYLQHVVVITGASADPDAGSGADSDAGSGADVSPDASTQMATRQHLDLLVLVLSPSPAPSQAPAREPGPRRQGSR
jgi:hypothetical protein